MRKDGILTWVELSRSALANNLKELSRLAGGRLMAVSVKANAYGHGLKEIVGLLKERNEAAYLTVHSLEEAVLCRQVGWKKKIMVLGPIPLAHLAAVFEYQLEPVVFNRETLDKLGKISTKRRIHIATHLKLETGTHRQGIMEKDLPVFAALYKKYPYLEKPLGASMHFANIEDTTVHEYAEYQLNNYNRLVKVMSRLGIKPRIRHTASSAALILFEHTRFEMVRPGIAVYGHWPSKETYLSYRLEGGRNNIFQPVMSLKTSVTQIKDIPADSFIGYGCTYRTTAPTRLAVLPVGYYDGYDRALSNRAYVLVRGRRAPVRGRICMNLMMVDITDIKGVKLEDEVVLIGQDGKEKITAEQLGEWQGTINYEILSHISQALSRKIVN